MNEISEHEMIRLLGIYEGIVMAAIAVNGENSDQYQKLRGMADKLRDRYELNVSVVNQNYNLF